MLPLTGQSPQILSGDDLSSDAGYPVYWCQHTDPNYSNTNHGWPAFAPKMLWQLWSSY